MNFLDELRTFERIAQAGSLSAAARELRIAPAGVSKRLDDLEARLGVRLVHRSTRGLILTEEGVTVLQDVRDLLDSAEALERKFQAQKGVVAGRLHVAAPSRFGERYVVPAVADFLERYEGAEVSLYLNDRYHDLIGEGLDLAIRIGSSPDSAHVTRKIAVSERIVCAAPAYLERMGTPVRPDELTGHACLVLGNKDVWSFRHQGHGRRVKVPARVHCHDGDVVLDLCRRGLGIALKSVWDVFEDVESGRLVPLLTQYNVEDDAEIFVLLPARRFVPPRVRAFIACLQAAIGDPPVWTRPTPPSPDHVRGA
jgi:DNA-binding transcriptional LysR family regulator